MEKYKEMLVEKEIDGRVPGLKILKGMTLLCHCPEDQECHADVLLERLGTDYEGAGKRRKYKDGYFFGNMHEDSPMVSFIDDGLPVRVSSEWEVLTHVADMAEVKGGYDHEVREGWTGNGRPRQAQFMGRDKPYADGGGLCSPGRWTRDKRRLPRGLPQKVLAKATEMLEKELGQGSHGKMDALGFVTRLACGKFHELPFGPSHTQGLRDWLAGELNMEPGDCGVAEGQVMHLTMISKLLEAFGDPDFEYFRGLESGVAIGVDITMPRTPAVFEEKLKWNLDDPNEYMVKESENYGTVAEHRDKVQALFEEEQAAGWMEEMTDAEAQRRFGDKLYIASLAVIEEKDKVRVVHDGTNGVQVNNRIRVRDQVRSPGAGELRALLRERQEVGGGRKWLALLGDASKAHRRIKVRREDWGLQGCRLEPGKVWVNKVGTYGVASAGYYWARLAAGALVRMFYYILGGGGQEALLFSDDLMMLAGRASEIKELGAMVFLWVALGVPFKWAKFRGGQEVDWIGYWVSFSQFRLGISASRAQWVRGWIAKILEEGSVNINDFHSFLGRICFIIGALDFLRPFVAPLFAWAASVGRQGNPLIPWSVSFLLRYLSDGLDEQGRAGEVKPRGRNLGVAFRADAKAEGHTVCVWGLGMPARTRSQGSKVVLADTVEGDSPMGVQQGRTLSQYSCS